LPASAERLVKLHETLTLVASRLGEGKFSGEERPLPVQYFKKGAYLGVRSIASTILVKGISARSFASLAFSGLGASNKHTHLFSPGTKVNRMYRTSLL
jgi:hypothetical protein